MTNVNERHIALKILEQLEGENQFLRQVVEAQFQNQDLTKQQRSFITKLVYGVVENRLLLNYFIDQVAQVKNNRMKPVIRYILQIGTYQLLFLDKVPNRAAVYESVKLVKKRKLIQLNGFVNGVLLKIEREQNRIFESIQALPVEKKLSILYSMEETLVHYLLDIYPVDELEAYLKASMDVKETCLRTNTLKTTPRQLKECLEKHYTLQEGYFFEEAMYLSKYNRLDDVDEFRKGWFQVQDESSMCVAHCVDLEAKKVIDVCSAPGGKITHLAERQKDQGQLIACDITEEKIDKIKENCMRLGIQSVEIKKADATVLHSEWVEQFDCVLADVPCSGLGILRTKPDIKHNMSLEKIQELLKIQKQILANVHQYVKIGGELIYSTCTINVHENEKQIEVFLNEYPNFERVDISKKLDYVSIKKYVKNGQIQLLTHQSKTDGFFIAKLRRRY